MRIGILTGNFHPEPGGPPVYLEHLLPALRARGHQIRVLTYGEPFAWDYGYPVTRISRRASIPVRLLRFSREALTLARWADVLYVQGYTVPLLAIRPVFRGRIVTKVVSDFSWEFARRHGLTALDVVSYQRARHPLRVRLLRVAYARATALSDAIITPGDHVAGLVQALGIPPAKIHVIHNAVPASGLQDVDRESLRRELGLPLAAPLLVSVGRLTAVKGVDIAIRALAHLPDAHLAIVGDGELRSELEKLAGTMGRQRVHFTGALPHETALCAIRAADVFVLSSHTEGLSHVLLEALSVGTPVAATAVGGNLEVLTDGVNGLLVPPANPLALANAIGRVLESPELAARLAQAGRARSAEFSWEVTVARTEALLIGS